MIEKKKIILIFKVVLITFFMTLGVKASNLYSALAEAYEKNPTLKSLRAKLQASDEDISKILSQKRPKIDLSAGIGADETTTINTSGVESTKSNKPRNVSVKISQNIFDSGRTKFALKSADNNILANRADLSFREQKILLATVKSYLNLYVAEENRKLSKNNLIVLQKHLEATQIRFEVGEVTSTDLSQAEARFLKAKAKEIKARGDIEVERSKYFSIVGKEAPKNLRLPKKYPAVFSTLKDNINYALKNNPQIIADGFRKKSSYLDISSATSELLPSIDLNISAQNAWDPNTFFNEYENYALDLNIKIPLYKGGENYSDIRKKRKLAIQQTKNLDVTLRSLVKEIEIAWLKKKNLEFQIKALKASVSANKTALNGVREELEVGSRTTLDVLDAEQELLEEKLELIVLEKNLILSSFELLDYLGKLNPQDLGLSVSSFDYGKNYKVVKKLWLGFESN
tara:strand:+ start:808 stop:2178 length:1371 start_codon:yes stop_codon:yes gene_type:complete